MAAQLFISYAREDRAFVRRVSDALAAHGNHTWIDTEGIEPSDRWQQSVNEAIDAADAVIAVVSRHSLSSEPCQDEVARAAGEHKRLIPVVVEDLPRGLVIPEALRELNWILLRPRDSFEQGLERLIRAIELDLDLVRIHTRALTRAQAWDLSGRRTTALLRGAELEQAERWLARAAAGSEPQPTELQASFVRASRRNTTRRHRIALGISATVAAVSIALAVFALVQRNSAVHQAHVATSRALAAQAQNHRTGDPQLALILALHAYHESPTPEAVTALRDGVRSSVVRGFLDRPGVFGLPEFDRTGKDVLSLNPAGTSSFPAEVRVWAWRRPADAANHLWVLHDHRASCVRFASNQAYVNIVNDDGTVLRWRWRSSSRATVIGKLPVHSDFCQLSPDDKTVAESTDSGVAIGTLTRPEERPLVLPGTDDNTIRSVVFSPDGKLVVTFEGAGPVRVYETATGRVLAQFDITHNDPLEGANGVAINPTDSLVAVAELSGDSPSLDIYSLHSPTSPPVIRPMSLAPPGLPTPSGSLGMMPAFVAWSPDGAALAVGWLGDTRVWWGSDPTPIYLNASDARADGELAFTADGHYLVTSGAVVQVWDWQVLRPRVLALSRTTQYASALLSPNGRNVAVGSGQGVCTSENVRLWHWRAGSTSTLAAGCPVAFSGDSRYLAVVSVNQQSTESVLSVWSDQTHQQLASLSVDGAILGVEFVGDSNSLAFTDSNHQLGSWDWRQSPSLASRIPVLRLSSKLSSSLVRSPVNDRSIYFLVGTYLYRWAGKLHESPIVVSRSAVTFTAPFRRAFTGYDEATLLPDHRHLVTSLGLANVAGSGVTVLSDIRTGRTHQLLPAYSTVQFALNRNDELIAFSGISGQVIVWDLNGNDPPVRVGTVKALSLSFDAPGSLLAVADQNAVELIPCPECGSVAHLLSVAKSDVVRSLTPREQRTYLHAG